MKWAAIIGVIISISFHSLCQAKIYTVGVDQINPPMSMRTDSADHFIGFEIDIMNEICARLHMQCNYQAVRANQIITNLELGKIDFAINSIIIPKFHLYGLILSLPYLPSYGQFVALKTSRIQKIEDIPGNTIGVRLGAFQVNVDSDMYIKHMFPRPPKIVTYYTISELLEALEDKDINVMFVNKYAADYWKNANQNLYKFIGEPNYLGNGYGIMSLTQYGPIISSMNGAIVAMMNDGTYAKIYQRYFTSFQ